MNIPFNLNTYDKVGLNEISHIMNLFSEERTNKEKQLWSRLNLPGVIAVHNFVTNRSYIAFCINVREEMCRIVDNLECKMFFDCIDLGIDYERYGESAFSFLILTMDKKWENFSKLSEEITRIQKSWPYDLYN